MRQIGNGLNSLFKFNVFNLIDKQCQQNRRRKRKDQRQTVQRQCVAQDIGQRRVVKKFSEIFKTHPFRTTHAGKYRVILKRNNNSIHGNIAENETQNQTGPNHGLHLELVVCQEIPPFFCGIFCFRSPASFRLFQNRHTKSLLFFFELSIHFQAGQNT